MSARGVKALTTVVQDTLNDADSIPECLRSTVNQLWLTYLHLKLELAQLIKTKNALIRQLQPCKKLMDLEGVAEVCAGLLYSSIGDGKQFKNGREASAFIGLTPKQHSSGGKVFMTGIVRAGGIKELRSALYQGALSYICQLPEEPNTAKQAWLIRLVQRAGIKRSCIALANKTVRTAWAMLRYENKYVQKPLLAI